MDTKYRATHPPSPGRLDGFRAALGAAAHAMREARRARRARNAMHAMSDHHLRDIGIRRDQLDMVNSGDWTPRYPEVDSEATTITRLERRTRELASAEVGVCLVA